MTTSHQPQEQPPKSTYFAFISYKREDEEWAKWLQHKLEHYKLPANLNGRTDLPKEIRPVFKDTSELNPGNLPQQIHDALEQSRYLIVICSPRSARSEWVNREVETFIGMGRTDRIIPFIIEGKAFASNADEECFPEAIRHLPADQEILGANINEMGRDAAAVKVVAQMFGVRFDELWQRYEREQRRKRHWIIAACFAGFLVMAGIAFWMYAQRQQTLRANWQMMENQARFVAEKAQGLVNQGDSYTAQRILLEILPKDVSHPIDKPYTPEAERTFRTAYSSNSTILRGHTGSISSAAFSPDGRRIVSASYDNTIRIWDPETGLETKKIENDVSLVNSVAYHPNGKSIVTASGGFFFHYGDICVWDVEGEPSGIVLAEQDYSFQTAAFSPNGSRIIITSMDPYTNDNSVKILDAVTGSKITILEGHTDWVKSASFSPDGKYVVTASQDNSVRIWNAETGSEILCLKSHKGNVNAATFSPDGKYVVSASSDHTIRIWDVRSGSEFRLLEGHTDAVNSVAFSPDGDFIVSASSDQTIRIWDARIGTTIRLLNGHTDAVNYAAFSPDSKQILSISSDQTIRLWDVEPQVEYKKLEGHTSSVNSAAFSPDGTRIISTSTDSTIRIWDAKTHSEILQLKNANWLGSAFFSPDGKRIVSSCDDIISLWDAETGSIIKQWQGDNYAIESVAFSPDGKNIVSVGSYSITIWDASTGSDIQHFSESYTNFNSVNISPDGNLVVATSGDILISDGTPIDNYVWIGDIKTGSMIQCMEGHTNIVNHAAFSPDGAHIASASDDNTIIIWDIQTGSKVKVLQGHIDGVNHVAFSPDGKYLVSASKDMTIRIWDVESGLELKTMAGHTNSIFSAVFSPDGKTIVSASYDGTLRVWDFPPLQELIDQTRERFKNRPLTPEERRMYYLE